MASLSSAIASSYWPLNKKSSSQVVVGLGEVGFEPDSLATEQGFPFFLTQGAIFHGVVLAERSSGLEGVARIQQGLAAFRATGAELYRPYFLGLLAEADGKADGVEEGLAVLTEAFA